MERQVGVLAMPWSADCHVIKGDKTVVVLGVTTICWWSPRLGGETPEPSHDVIVNFCEKWPPIRHARCDALYAYRHRECAGCAVMVFLHQKLWWANFCKKIPWSRMPLNVSIMSGWQMRSSLFWLTNPRRWPDWGYVLYTLRNIHLNKFKNYFCKFSFFATCTIREW